MKILDATCGQKSMWFVKNHPLVTFLDKREGKYMHWDKKNASRRTAIIKPDIVADWTKKVPFDDNYFDMILFDPPHAIRNKVCDIHNDMYFGILKKDTWKQDLKKGIKELFRVLKPEGVFVFKWGDSSKSINEIIKLFPYPPLFGNKTSKASTYDKGTHWIIFIKYRLEQELKIN